MRALVNILSNWTGFVLSAVIAFALSPFIVHQLGDARYGVWALVVAIIGYLNLLDLGIRVAVTRFVAHHEAKQDQEGINRIVTAALVLFTALGALAAVTGGGVALWLPHLTEIPGHLVSEARFAVAISGLTVAIGLIGGVYGGIVAGLQRFTRLNAISVVTELLRAGAVVGALSGGGGLIDLALIQLAVVSSRGLLYEIASRRLQPLLRTRRAFLDTATLRQIVWFSGFTTLLHMSAGIIFSSDAVVIAALMPVAQVTFFVIAANLIQSVLQILGGVSQALFPLVSSRQATHGTAATAYLVEKSMRLSTCIVLPILATLLFRGRTFIGLWMGESYAAPSGQVLEILSVGLCFFASYQVLTISIVSLNLHRGLVPAFIAEALSNLGISILLGSAIGIAGVAWGTTIPRLAVSLGFGPWFLRKHLNVSFRAFAIHAWVRPFASMIPFAVLTVVVDRMWLAPDLVVFFLQVAAVLPVAGLGIWLVGLERDERALMGTSLKRMKASLAGAA